MQPLKSMEGTKMKPNWDRQKGSCQGVVIDINKRIVRYNPKKYTIRIAGTRHDPQLYIYGYE